MRFSNHYNKWLSQVFVQKFQMIAKHQLPKLFARCAKQVGTEIPTSFPREAVSYSRHFHFYFHFHPLVSLEILFRRHNIYNILYRYLSFIIVELYKSVL